ncbi:MAG: DNRLRE domain-containing protein, partial [Candidatus Zixiibacteriota bacterium]
ALLAGLIAYLVVGGPALADMVTLGTAKDNTLYEDAQGDRSNGAGQYFFVGKTGPLAIELRRGLVQFDIAGNVPAGVTIDSVRLRLHMSKTNSLGQNVSLRRVLADWGEGASDAAGEEGAGGPAAAGDATWLHQFFNTTTWAAPGGDFSGTVSATTNVTTIGFYNWGSTPQMRMDVQGWLDNPASNFGWILIGNEAATGNAQRFTAKEDTIPANRPSLVVHYSIPVGCACPFQSDLDENGFVDATDLAFVIDIVFFGASDLQDPDCPRTRADFNADGFADATDLAFLIDHVFFGGPGPVDPCL